MKKIVFRASRGNALIHSMPIDIEIKEYLGQSKLKDVYIITFQEGETLRAKLERVCDSFNTDHYQVPNDDIRNKIEHIKDKIKETEYLINTTNNEMRAYLCKVCKLKETYLVNSGISRLMLYKLISEYDKAVYLNLNKLVPKTSLFQGYFWSARGSGEILQKLDHEECYLTEIQFEDSMNHKIPPPTFFRTNAFLDPFQEIVNTYGIP